MPRYAYRAIAPSGSVAKGEMTAANENELAQVLGLSGMELISAHTARNLSGLGARGITARAHADVFARLRDLLSAGLDFPKALVETANATAQPPLRSALQRIAASLTQGQSIAQAFAQYPRFFSPLTLALLAAGEKSGAMPRAASYLAELSAATARSREKMRRALLYPVFLFFVAGGAVAFMLTNVVPQIILFLRGLDGTLPWSTRALIALSTGLAETAPVFAVVFAVLVIALALARKHFHDFAVGVDRCALRLPFIGSFLTKSALARFALAFALLFRSGCAVPDALAQAKQVTDNHYLRHALEDAERDIVQGSSLSLALSPVFPPFALGLLRTGESSGDLAKALDDISAAYTRETEAASDAFIAALEPTLTLFLGGILAWTVMAMLGPLYASLSILGGRM